MHQSPEHEKLHPTGHSFMISETIKKTYTVAAHRQRDTHKLRDTSTQT